MAQNPNHPDWLTNLDTEEVASLLELIARQSPADVNYYVHLDAARRLRGYAAT